MNNWESVITDGQIDLYLNDYQNFDYGQYLIFLHETQMCVGSIKFSKNEVLGDISFEIKKQFRGNGYALKALKLMTDVLYKNGIYKVYISAEKDNKPSIKTIEKFGGKPIREFWNGQATTYECDLHQIKNNQVHFKK